MPQKAGKEATGQLANIAKKAGFNSGGWAAVLVGGAVAHKCLRPQLLPRLRPTPACWRPHCSLPPSLSCAAVKDLLDKNPHAKALQLPKLPSEGGAGRSGSRGPRSDGATAAAREGEDGEGRKRPAQKRKAQAAEEAERELIADDALPPRAEEMPVRGWRWHGRCQGCGRDM